MKTRILISMLVALGTISLLNGCATKISSFPVANDGTNRKGGIPYFIPKPMLAVKQPIEVVRSENVFAIISLGGIQEFLYEIDYKNFDSAIQELKKVIKAPPGSVKLEELKTKSTYITEETIQKSQHDKITKKYGTLTASSSKEAQSTLLKPYSPADIDKSISILLVPDFKKEYELVIDPSWFSSLEIGVTLTEGWRLDGLTSKSGENQLIGALKDVASTIIGAQKDIDVAKIGKEQVLKLKELEIEAAKGDEKVLEFMPSVNVSVKIKGYLKKITIQTIKPGIYDLSEIMDSKSSWEFPTEKSAFMQRFQP